MLVELALGGHYVFRPLEDDGLPTNRFGILVRSGGALHLTPAIFFEGLSLMPGAI